MRLSAVIALLFSAAVLAAPMQDMDQSESVQDVAEYADVPDFADAAEFAEWMQTADLESMENGKIFNVLKKGAKVLGKVGKVALKHGPQIVDTITNIHNTLKGGSGGGAAEEAPADAPQ